MVVCITSWNSASKYIQLLSYSHAGNTAPYHITQPSTDYDVQIVSSTATMVTVSCSLNVSIPGSVTVIWTHNSIPIPNGATQTTAGNTATLLIENLQPSDAGVYQCVFDDAVGGSGWILRRNIRLLIIGMLYINIITLFSYMWLHIAIAICNSAQQLHN